MLFSILLGCGRNVKFDVGFAIDGSNSIDDNEYRQTKDFVKDVIKAFSIAEDGTHVALLQYATKGIIKLYFDENYFNPKELLDKVEQIENTNGGSTNIGRGLVKTLEMFSPGNGMRGDDVSIRFINNSSVSSVDYTEEKLNDDGQS